MNNNFIASPLLGAKQLAVSWITLLLCFCSPPVVAKDVLNVGFIERAPSIYQTASGDMRGVLGKRIAQILKDAKIDVTFVATQPSQIDSFIANQSIQGFIATRTLVRNNDGFLFSSEPLIELMFYAYHLESTRSLDNIIDLKNANIVLPISPSTMRGPLKNQIAAPENNVNVFAVESNFERQMRSVRNGDADYAISYFSPNNVAMLFSKRDARGNIVSSELFAIPMYFVIREDTPRAREIIQQIDAVMTNPKPAGFY